MALWLLNGSKTVSSMTSNFVFIIGSIILIWLYVAKPNPNSIKIYFILIAFIFLILQFVADLFLQKSLLESIITSSGRDMTFTGRTDLWKTLIDIGSRHPIFGIGYGSFLALQSASEIEKKLNISVKVINLSTIKPIDKIQLINEIKNVKAIILIEEHNVYCGVGSILARIISENSPLPIKFVGINNSFGESGKREEVLSFYGLNIKNIMDKVYSLLEK